METVKRQKVLIALPTSGTIHHKVVGTLCAILLQNKDYEIDTYISQMVGIGEHRNVIVKDFLKTDCNWLLMIDDDNPPPLNVLDLIKLDLPVIGLPTPINMSPCQGVTEIVWNVYRDIYPRKDKGEGLEKVDMVGTGVILIRRDVLEKIENPFTTVRDKSDLRIVGTDMAFCHKCQEKQIDIYTHWDYVCSHFKTIDLKTLCSDF